MKKLRYFRLPLLLSAFFILASAKRADDTGIERLHDANNVLVEFSKMKESIPHQLLEEYQGVVVIPKLLNAGLIVGAKRGKGIAMVKTADGKWSDPVFVTLTGGSFGFQVGVQSVDLVLVFRNKGVLTKVKNGDFTLGGDISAAAGPVGRSSTASTDYKLQAEVYSYSRSKGLFAGISIHGSNLAIDKKANAAFYGTTQSSSSIFESSNNTSDAVVKIKTTLGSF